MCLAVPGRILSTEEEEGVFRKGKVSFGGIVKEVNLSFVPEAGIGDYVLVHVGVALNRIQEKQAFQVFRYLEEMGELPAAHEENA